MIILKQELVVESNSGISVLTKGTKLKLVIENKLRPEEFESFNVFNEVLTQYIPEQAVVVDSQLKEDSQDVEGQQTDVDDFDVHKVDIVYGKIVFEVSIPKESIPIKFSAADVLDETSQLNRFMASSGISQWDDLDEMLAEKADLSSWGIRDTKNSQSNIVSQISKKTTDDMLVIDIIWDVNIQSSIDKSSIIHKGGYRTGGRYPDA